MQKTCCQSRQCAWHKVTRLHSSGTVSPVISGLPQLGTRRVLLCQWHTVKPRRATARSAHEAAASHFSRPQHAYFQVAEHGKRGLSSEMSCNLWDLERHPGVLCWNILVQGTQRILLLLLLPFAQRSASAWIYAAVHFTPPASPQVWDKYLAWNSSLVAFSHELAAGFADLCCFCSCFQLQMPSLVSYNETAWRVNWGI